MRAFVRLSVATSAAVLFLVPGVAHAGGGASPPVLSDPIATGLAGPLQIAVGERGDVYVAQDFAGVLTRIDRRGNQSVIAANPGGEIAGVDVEDGKVVYTSAVGDQTGFTVGQLNKIERDGSSSVVADVLAYEQRTNPDQVYSYGFETLTPECAAQWPVDQAGPPQYTGQVDSHAYAVAIADGHRYIADAGGNTILDVTRNGKIRTVAVLPPQPIVVPVEVAAGLGAPACAGLTYGFEAVPTDVEVGRDGMLYVTTLPGGPEDPSLGARGSVYRVNPWNGNARRIATGFLGATNLAIGRGGAIYVTELFAGRISRVVRGGPEPVIELASPAALEYADGKLYVSYDVFANGSVATISVGGGRDHGDW